jgi:hypothetical protein
MEYEGWIRDGNRLDSNNDPFKVHGVKRRLMLYVLPYFKAYNELFQCDNQFTIQWRGLCHVSSNVNPIGHVRWKKSYFERQQESFGKVVHCPLCIMFFPFIASC